MVNMTIRTMIFIMEKEFNSLNDYYNDLGLIKENVNLNDLKYINVMMDKETKKWKAELKIASEIKRKRGQGLVYQAISNDETDVVILIFPLKGWKIEKIITAQEERYELACKEIEDLKLEREKLLKAQSESDENDPYHSQRKLRLEEINYKIDFHEKNIKKKI